MRFVLCALALAAIGCRQPRLVTPVSPAGCYALTLGPWSSGLFYELPPTTIALDDVRVVHSWFRDGRTHLRVRPDIKQTRDYFPPPTWWFVGADSVLVDWNTGYTGYILSLGKEQGGVRRGAYEAFHDHVRHPEPPPPRAEVLARRTDCTTAGI